MDNNCSVIEALRTCVGCRRITGANELHRLQLRVEVDGTVSEMTVESRSVGGRGAWLCRAPESLREGRSVGDLADSSSFDFLDSSFDVSEGGNVLVLASCAALATRKKAFARGFKREVPGEIVAAFVTRHT